MSESKSVFIKRLAEKLGRDHAPEAPSPFVAPNKVQHAYMKDAPSVELKEVFVQNAKAMGTAVYECLADKLQNTVAQAVANFPKGPVQLTHDALWWESGTLETLKATGEVVSMWDVNSTREHNIEYAEQASVGVARAELALAESATVLLFSHQGCGRAVTLLPTTTVFVVREEDIRPRLTQGMALLMEQAQEGLPSSVNFVSSASATADIELVRVQGVHGPIEISYVVVSS